MSAVTVSRTGVYQCGSRGPFPNDKSGEKRLFRNTNLARGNTSWLCYCNSQQKKVRFTVFDAAASRSVIGCISASVVTLFMQHENLNKQQLPQADRHVQAPQRLLINLFVFANRYNSILFLLIFRIFFTQDKLNFRSYFPCCLYHKTGPSYMNANNV